MGHEQLAEAIDQARLGLVRALLDARRAVNLILRFGEELPAEERHPGDQN